MKRVSMILTLVLFSTIGAFAQLENPVSWAYTAKKVSKTEAVVYIKATIDDTWHIYSQNIKSGGPSATIIKFTPSKDFSLVGKTIEPKPITKFEKTFNMNVLYFENQVVFQQKIKLNKASTAIKGKIEFMVCNDISCLPPSDVEFSIPVK
ncbi:MAG: protein-disulfide reductase DsbD domain-containing protein [Bacteroidota bacterium]